MADIKAPKARMIGGLALAFVLVFIVYIAYDTLFKPAPVAPETLASSDTAPIHVVLELKDGPVDIDLLPKLAPEAAGRLVALIGEGFYDGIVFHRVIDGFMAQTGDPTGTGMGGSDLPDLPAEFTDEPFERGVIGMARTNDPNSANSQFFIMLAPAPHLNGQYTVVGRVTSGMEHVDAIKKGDPARNGLVEDPDRIISFRLADGQGSAAGSSH